MFWVASEGKSLPDEMRGPRLMQQLRERAGKIVQHLTVQEVAHPDGIDLIKKTMERSPIIKLLDQKKIDQRRQKFMKLSRLPHESLESFINRAEIYRRENQSSPAYQVGSQFYVGHLIDAAKLTKRDQALLKAACGGTLDDEDAVTTSLIDLADQLEGLPGCPIGRGEPTLDHEDRYLVQKPGANPTSLTASSATSQGEKNHAYRRPNRRKFYGRKKFRDALMAILEDDDGGEEDDEDPLAEVLGDESCDEDEGGSIGDMNTFNPPDLGQPMEANVAQTSLPPSSTPGPPVPEGPLAEIYAQEYKARNRVREIKKMRQYFQREANGGGAGNNKERDQVKRWVKEQQKTEACFICRQLGHWSQECPYRNRAPVHASNVTFPGPSAHQGADWSVLQQCAQSDACYKVAKGKGAHQHEHGVHVQQVQQVHDVYWSLSEMGNKMILDLGCMKTVAGTTWINPIVQKWKAHGQYVKVVPEKESFRFGDGHVRTSKYSVVLHVSLAGIPCLLRISVVAGDCPPLLSKPVCTALKFMIDTETHTLSSRRFGIKAFGLSQSKGGHYLLPIDELQHCQPVPPEMRMDAHLEVLPLSVQQSGSKQSMIAAPTDHFNSLELPPGHGGSSFVGVGASGHGVFELGSRSGHGRARDPQDEEEGQDAASRREAQASCHLTIPSTVGIHAATVQANAGDDAADAGHDRTCRHGPSGHHDSKQFCGGAQNHSEDICTKEAQQECGLDRHGGSLSDIVPGLFRGRDVQRDPQPPVADPHLQMEDAPFVAAYQEGCGRAKLQTPVEAQPSMDHAHARPTHGRALGPHGIGPSTLLQPKGLLPGNGNGADDRGRGTSAGAQAKLQSSPELMPVSDPNAATPPEQQRREGDRIDVVLQTGSQDLCAGEGRPSDAGEGNDQGQGHGGADALHSTNNPGGAKKITLNRGQKRAIQIGLQKSLRTHKRMYDVVQAKYKSWTILEVFAGHATLSQLAGERGCWEVLPPQDVIFGPGEQGLDLKRLDHQQILKEVIQSQRPEVITLSPPCGPWSSWQRMRKNRQVLQALRRQHKPFWDFVCWVWAFQNTHNGLAVLEQPAQSDALRTPEMSRRERVHQQRIDMCELGLVDWVSGAPHKEPTVIQMNHPMINATAFPPKICSHAPGDHQPIKGSVRIPDPDNPQRMITVKRSTLAAQWTLEFCDWVLSGLEAGLELSAQETHVALHTPTPDNRTWETVPVDVEQTPEGQLRQQMQTFENGTRYDYINFAGSSALLSRGIRSTLAHLHVALGHLSNTKLKRMLQLNGAKPEILSAVDDLQCQICNQVVAPTATPKAAFARPMIFNDRLVADTFYIWDSSGQKFAVTHLLDAFSLYQVAHAVQDASADESAKLIRDRWIAVFGPPTTLMTDQGPEFRGVLEQLLRRFAVYHDMVPPSAHWRMALAERHGAVLKVLLMKVIKELTIHGLDELQTAVVSVCASRNRQARVSGFAPIQLVFGKDTSLPENLMNTLAGQLQFQLSRPSTVEESFVRANQIRKAAADAFQWMEANDALKRAAGSRSRLPKLELLTEGAQVMYWQPPAHRRGLARRLQDDISWIGPGLVVAIERKDGAIKRVWVRYQNKLRGMPLEHVRLAVAEEMEATQITLEAMKDMERQINEGRVNAEVASSSSSDSSSEDEVEKTEKEMTDKQSRAATKATSQRSVADKPKKVHFDPAYPPVEFSDEEQEGAFDVVGDEDLKKATSPLDDVPLALHRSTAASSSQRPQKKARLAQGARDDPSMRPFVERRAVFDKAMHQTRDHLRQMKQKLEPKSVQMAMPTQSGSQRDQMMVDAPAEAPFVDIHRFYNPEYSDSDEQFSEVLALSLDRDVLQTLPLRTPQDLRLNAPDFPSDSDFDEVLEVERSTLRRDAPLLQETAPDTLMVHSMPAIPQTRMRLPPTLESMLKEVPTRLRRPLTKQEQAVL